MKYSLRQCKATVEMSLEQIVDIEKAFARVQELEQELRDTKLQLSEARYDLDIICKHLYVSHDGDSVCVNNFGGLTPQGQEGLIFTIKRNQNV